MNPGAPHQITSFGNKCLPLLSHLSHPILDILLNFSKTFLSLFFHFVFFILISWIILVEDKKKYAVKLLWEKIVLDILRHFITNIYKHKSFISVKEIN